MAVLDTPSGNSPSSYWNTILRFGGIGAIVMVLFSLLWYLLDINMMSMGNMAIMYILIFGFTITIAVLAIKGQRSQDGGYIGFGRAFVIGGLSTAIGVFFSSIFNFILVNYIDPGYVDKLKEQFVDAWGDKMPAESLEQALAKFEKSGDLLANLSNGLVGGLVIGLIVGLIAAAFMKRERPLE